MNRCPNCAAQNRDGAKFCTSCGFRLPGDSSIVSTADRSPFATTSNLPSSNGADETIIAEEVEVVEPGTDVWVPETLTSEDMGPGLSWHSDPPRDTSVPVSDEMIASLVSDAVPEPEVIELGELISVDEAEDAETFESIDTGAEPFDATQVSTAGESPVSIHGLLRLARELEYGLVELAETNPAAASANGDDLDARLLTAALADLQSDEDLAPLRESIATAQERPRDVDVMLDLVLRADSIATLIAERDQLKHAIEIALGVNSTEPAAPVVSATDEPDQV